MQTLVELEKEEQDLRSQLETYFSLCAAGHDLGELQDDYNEVVAQHVKILDTIKKLKEQYEKIK